MRNNAWRVRALCAAVVGVCLVSAASADTFVYRADPPEYRMGWGSMVVDREWGCEVELAGAERHVTELMLVADPPNGGTMDVAGRIYANDGQGGEPGSLLWDSGWRCVSFADGEPLPLTFEAPGVLVPDRITAVLAIENISNTSYGGMERTDNITVGTVHTRWSRLPGSDWVQGLEDGTSVQMHVLAIPEPATMGLLALGGLALIRRRRA